MPKRYIDADYVLKAIGAENSCGQCKQSSFDCFCHWLSRQDICGIINDAPTADVQPVKRGEWIYGENDYDDSTYYCSICGEPWTLIAGTPLENNMHYCPNCGAKMDGDGDGV